MREAKRFPGRAAGRCGERGWRPLALRASALVIVAFTATASVMAQATPAFVQVAGSLTRDLTGAAGETLAQTITVKNVGEEPAYVNVSFADVTVDKLGIATASNSPQPRSNKGWVSGPTAPVLVPGGQTVTIPYSLRIPPDAAGGYWSSVVVQPDTFVEQAWNINDRTRVPLQLVAQYAGVIFVNVNATGTNEISFTQATVVEGHAQPAVEIVAVNGGDRADVFRIRAELLTLEGDSVHTEVMRARLIGGNERIITVPLGDAPAGEYILVLTADAGQPRLFARQFRISLP